MASSTDNGKKPLEKLESRKSHSWWWESHIGTRNAKWLSNSLSEMEQSTESMKKLIQSDGDSFAKKAEMYYKRRPELITQVDEFQRMYRTLAERYGQLTGDLQKNMADMHLHSSAAPDLSSEPITPRFKHANGKFNPFRSTHRAAGFDVFLGLFSDRSSGEASPAPGSEEPVDHNEKTIQMDAELDNDKEKTGMPNSGLIELQLKVAGYEVEIGKLKMELENVRSLNNKFKIDEQGVIDVKEDNFRTELEVSDPEKVRGLFEELKRAKGRLHDLEMQNEKLSTENKLAYEYIQQLQDQLKEAAAMRSKLHTEMSKSPKFTEETARLKSSLSEREGESRELKETLAYAGKKYQTTENDGLEKNPGDEIEHLKLKYMRLMSEREELKLEVERQRELILEAEEEKREAIRQLCFSLDHYQNCYEKLRLRQAIEC